MKKFIISHGSAASCWLDDVFEKERTNIPHILTPECEGHGAHIKSPMELVKYYGTGCEVIYPVRNPVDTIISYARRNFFTFPDHIQNIGGDVNKWFSYYSQYNPQRSWSIEKTIDTYIENGSEFFKIKDHILAWKSFKNTHFFKYENIEKDWDTICRLMGSDFKSDVDNFIFSSKEINSNTRQRLTDFLKSEIEVFESV